MAQLPEHKIKDAHPALRFMVIAAPLLFSVLTWTVVGSLFLVRHRGGSSGDLAAFVALAFMTFIFFVAGFAIAMLVNPHRSDQIGLIAASTVTVLFSGFSAATLFVLVLVAGGLTLYRRALHAESRSRIKFSFNKTIQASLGLVLTLLLFAVALQSLATAAPVRSSRDLLTNVLSGTRNTVLSIAPKFFSGFEKNKSVDQYFAEQTGNDSRSVAASRDELGKNLKLSLTGTETMGEIVQRALETRLQPSLERFSSLILPILVVSLFLLLKLFSPLLTLGIWAVGLLLFHLYQRFGLVHVEEVPARVDRLQLT